MNTCRIDEISIAPELAPSYQAFCIKMASLSHPDSLPTERVVIRPDGAAVITAQFSPTSRLELPIPAKKWSWADGTVRR